ncbi:aldo/keto reductase [Sorangium sp. So ce118]
MKRRWERAGIETSALGLGCWPSAGKWNDPAASWEWHGTDDAESVRAIRAGIDAGVTLLDTADVYGSGHSEVLVGKAIQEIRDRVTLATKFGHLFEEKHANLGRTDASPAYIRRAVEGSLRRLGTDRIDLYQLHIWEHPPEKAGEVVEALEHGSLARCASSPVTTALRSPSASWSASERREARSSTMPNMEPMVVHEARPRGATGADPRKTTRPGAMT